MSPRRALPAGFRIPAGVVVGVAMSVAAPSPGAAERIPEEEAMERGRPHCVEELTSRAILNLGPGPYFISPPSVYWHPPKGRYYLEYTEHTHLCEYRCTVELDAAGGDPSVRFAIAPNHEGPRGRQELFECS